MGNSRQRHARHNEAAVHAKRRILRWPIDRLRPHPKQTEIFGDVSDAVLEELAADLKKNGLTHPVEVLSDGTIVAGHQRVRAAKLLKWSEIRCWVRTDLEEAGPAAIEQRLVADNLNRRHLDELQIARCYLHLKRLEQGEPSRERVRGDVRDRLAKRFGYSGRQLDRLTRLLELPSELQRAYSSRTLSQATALKIAALPRKTQQRIAERVAGGETVEQAAADYLTKPSTPSKKIGTAISRFVGALRMSIVDLQGRIGEFQGRLPKDDRRVLKVGRELAHDLLQASARNEERRRGEDDSSHEAVCQLSKARSSRSGKRTS